MVWRMRSDRLTPQIVEVLEAAPEFNFANKFQDFLDDPKNSTDDQLRAAAEFDEIVANIERLDPHRGIDDAAARFFQVINPN